MNELESWTHGAWYTALSDWVRGLEGRALGALWHIMTGNEQAIIHFDVGYGSEALDDCVDLTELRF